MKEFLSFVETILTDSTMNKWMLVAICITVFYLLSKLLHRISHEVSVRRALGTVRLVYITRLTNIGIVFLCLVTICMIFGFGYSQVSVFISSVFAVVGIALFAQWSILSNVTASMIIFFSFPYRVNDRIRILDKDDDMSGVIIEISMFHVILQRDDGNLITYPNTLILQKAVLKIDHPEKTKKADEEEDG